MEQVVRGLQLSSANRAQNSDSLLGVRIPAYTVISRELFDSQYWPKLQSAIEVMLNQNPGEFIQLSYEDLYSTAYKCATQQYSEEMYVKANAVIERHLFLICQDLENCAVENFLEKFSFLLAQYLQAVDGLSSVFSYMDRAYVVISHGKSFSSLLLNQFADTIASRSLVFDVLEKASENIIETEPHILMSVVKGLYSLRPGFAVRNMQLFSRFIPNIAPSLRVENLPMMVKETALMQKELTEKYGFARNSCNKRKIDEVTTELIENEKRTLQST